MREPETHGNPGPDSVANPFIWVDFDTEVSQGNRGIDVTDADLLRSTLIINPSEIFTVASVFAFGGAFAVGFWKHIATPFTISYYAEPMTGAGGNVLLGSALLVTNAGILTPAAPPKFPNSYLRFGEGQTQHIVNPATLPGGPLPTGLYRLTAYVNFSRGECPLPFNAYVSGPILEVHSFVL